jgi:hypothetical protein
MTKEFKCTFCGEDLADTDGGEPTKDVTCVRCKSRFRLLYNNLRHYMRGRLQLRGSEKMMWIIGAILFLVACFAWYCVGYLHGLRNAIKTLREIKDELKILFEPDEDDGEAWKRGKKQ